MMSVLTWNKVMSRSFYYVVLLYGPLFVHDHIRCQRSLSLVRSIYKAALLYIPQTSGTWRSICKPVTVTLPTFPFYKKSDEWRYSTRRSDDIVVRVSKQFTRFRYVARYLKTLKDNERIPH